MPDPPDRYSRALIERLLEPEEHDHPVHVPADIPQPPPAPGPELRADVVDDRDAVALDQGCDDREVEIAEVHEDDEVGPLRAEVGFEQPLGAQQPGEVPGGVEGADGRSPG